MPISDYASAYFFDRRKRVTLKRVAVRSRGWVAICKVWPSITFVDAARAFPKFKEARLADGVPSKITGAPALRPTANRGATQLQKEKARREPGFVTNIFFVQFYFASFAI